MQQTFEYKSVQPLKEAIPEGAKFRDMEPAFMDSLLLANHVPRGGVIHLGANRGQEVWMYTLLGFRRALMVEPLPTEFQHLALKCSDVEIYTRAQHEMIGEEARPPIEFQCVQCAVADRSGTSTFFQTAASVVSSLSRPVNKTEDGRYDFEEIEVETRTLDDLMQTLPDGWSAEDFTYLRMNIQNSELLALRGGERVLRNVHAVFLEVNVHPRYENQPVKEEFDRLLGDFGFECTFGMVGGAVGNLFYRRR
jgi:FkbM family methyltransferase